MELSYLDAWYMFKKKFVEVRPRARRPDTQSPYPLRSFQLSLNSPLVSRPDPPLQYLLHGSLFLPGISSRGGEKLIVSEQ
jgi:hypothetical protein